MTILNAVSMPDLEDWVLNACALVRRRAADPISSVATARVLIQCVLGSRVRHDITVAATKSVWAQVRDSWYFTSDEELKACVRDVLLDPDADSPRYPYPDRGATLVAGALRWLERSAEHLASSHLDGTPPRAARRMLLDCPGLGPKQASLFLRCLRPSARLAVLDSRVLAYLSYRLPSRVPACHPASLRRYEAIEDHYLEYADWLGQEPAVLDLAIWYVTRAVSESLQ